MSNRLSTVHYQLRSTLSPILASWKSILYLQCTISCRQDAPVQMMCTKISEDLTSSLAILLITCAIAMPRAQGARNAEWMALTMCYDIYCLSYVEINQ